MAKVYVPALVGVDVELLEVEAIAGQGFSGLHVLGLPANETKDTRERIRSALETVGIQIPTRRFVVNVTPADRVKLARNSLAQLDFGIAAALVKALHKEEKNNDLENDDGADEIYLGELGLEGQLKPLESPLLLDILLEKNKETQKQFFAPKSKLKRNSIFQFSTFSEWIENPHPQHLTQEIVLDVNHNLQEEPTPVALQALKNLRKHPTLCSAMMIAAAGNHHILLMGEPGVGKSYALSHLPSLLPPLSQQEKLNIQLIHEKAKYDKIIRPFRTPHHSTTSAALIGGANLKPGEVTLATHGVLFLDELTEFSRQALESLREPLDQNKVTIAKASGSIEYPADFLLCAATNPCFCGYLISRKKACRCMPQQVRKNLQKLSGPLLDRFGLQLWVEPLPNPTQNLFALELLKERSSWEEYWWEKIQSVQTEISEKGFGNISIPEIFSSDLTQRGIHHLEKMAWTCSQVFSVSPNHPQFWPHLKNYRNIEYLLNHKRLI